MSSTTVAVRLFKKGDDRENWEAVPIAGYLPVFLAGAQNTENIEKRIRMLFLRDNPEVEAVRWNYKDEDESGVWIA